MELETESSHQVLVLNVFLSFLFRKNPANTPATRTMADAPLLGGANDVNRATGSISTIDRNVDSSVIITLHLEQQRLIPTLGRATSLRIQDPARWIDSTRRYHVRHHHDFTQLRELGRAGQAHDAMARS